MRKCLIADDHAVVRAGLTRMLAQEFPDTSFGSAANTAETLDQVAQEPWDLLVLDLSLPGRGGLEVLREVRILHPRLPVIVFSMHPEEQYGARVLRAGASGFLSKEASSEQIVAAVRTVLAGRRFVSPMLAEILATNLAAGDAPPHTLLSDREFQVLCLIAQGRSVGEIAEQLSLSSKTVSTYRTRILEKLALKSTSELIRYTIDHNLTDTLPPSLS